jgi:methylated-DNA-[protein]-cysteine S-methyltransferase
MRHLYTVPAFGVGEVWTRDGTIVRHELASEALRLELEREPAVSARLGWNAGVDQSPVGPATPKASTVSPDGGARLPARTLPPMSSPVCDDCVPDLCRRIALHLAGVPTSYEGIPIDLEWATPLQHAFAAAARAIPWGDIVSYGELAVLAGRPGAARAAGSFCAENRFSLIVPCHRVVAANGIGGYGVAGVELKSRLLALEGVRL